MIAECEADERDSKLYPGGKPPRGPKVNAKKPQQNLSMYFLEKHHTVANDLN